MAIWNGTTRTKSNRRGSGSALNCFVVWLAPKTVRRLQMLDGFKTTTYHCRRNYGYLRNTNHGKGGELAMTKHNEAAKLFNANKYWWMKSLALIAR